MQACCKVVVLGSSGAAGSQLVSSLSNDARFSIEAPPSAEYWEASYVLPDDAEVLVMCLPDDMASAWRATHEVKDSVVLIDAGFGPRFDDTWHYGYRWEGGAQVKDHPLLSTVRKLANPGCFATGMQLILRPLVECAWWESSWPLAMVGITGYSAGGTVAVRRQQASPLACRQSNVMSTHGHAQEVKHHLSIANPLVLETSVTNIERGQSVSLALPLTMLPNVLQVWDERNWVELFKTYYQAKPDVQVNSHNVNSAILDTLFESVVSTETSPSLVKLFVNKQDDWLRVQAVYDNLGVGASGNIVAWLSDFVNSR